MIALFIQLCFQLWSFGLLVFIELVLNQLNKRESLFLLCQAFELHAWRNENLEVGLFYDVFQMRLKMSFISNHAVLTMILHAEMTHVLFSMSSELWEAEDASFVKINLFFIIFFVLLEALVVCFALVVLSSCLIQPDFLGIVVKYEEWLRFFLISFAVIFPVFYIHNSFLEIIVKNDVRVRDILSVCCTRLQGVLKEADFAGKVWWMHHHFEARPLHLVNLLEFSTLDSICILFIPLVMVEVFVNIDFG